METEAQQVLNALDCPDSELSVLIVSDEQMAELNSRYLGRSGPTNVLAFPMAEGPFEDLNPEILGDVAICPHVAAKEAADAGVDLEHRLLELLIHGILHLAGYDHGEEEEADLMSEQERRIFELITGNRKGS